MTITLQLSSEQERLLKERAAQQDGAAVREVLLQVLDIAVEDILQSHAQHQSETRQALLDELAAEFVDLPPLPDEALSRDSIYEDRL